MSKYTETPTIGFCGNCSLYVPVKHKNGSISTSGKCHLNVQPLVQINESGNVRMDGTFPTVGQNQLGCWTFTDSYQRFIYNSETHHYEMRTE